MVDLAFSSTLLLPFGACHPLFVGLTLFHNSVICYFLLRSFSSTHSNAIFGTLSYLFKVVSGCFLVGSSVQIASFHSLQSVLGEVDGTVLVLPERHLMKVHASFIDGVQTASFKFPLFIVFLHKVVLHKFI